MRSWGEVETPIFGFLEISVLFEQSGADQTGDGSASKEPRRQHIKGTRGTEVQLLLRASLRIPTLPENDLSEVKQKSIPQENPEIMPKVENKPEVN